MEFSKSKAYFEEIAKKIDGIENPTSYPDHPVIIDDSYGEVDGNSEVVSVPSTSYRLVEPENSSNPIQDNLSEIQENIPKIDADRIDGVISLYKEMNQTYGLKFDSDKVTSIGGAFKAIINPENKEIFEIYLREYLDRLRLVCINQLGNTVYSLIQKLTSEETIRALTISERVALLDRLFEYMDKINNMAQLIPKGDTKSELKEIAARDGSEDGSSKKQLTPEQREARNYIISLLDS